MTPQELINSNFEQYRTISEVAQELRSLARAFHRTGNDRMAEQLSILANDVAEAGRTLQGNYAQEQNMRINETREEISGLLGVMVTRMHSDLEKATKA